MVTIHVTSSSTLNKVVFFDIICCGYSKTYSQIINDAYNDK